MGKRIGPGFVNKDGRCHLKYKAENAVDLYSEIIVAAEVHRGDAGDTQRVENIVNTAQTNLDEAVTECEIEEVVADKGYHSELTLDDLQNESGYRTYIPEQERKDRRSWKGNPKRREASYGRNRRNTRGARGRRLQRQRSERVERTFAHLCDTGGSRRTWLRGLAKVRKHYRSAAMAFNLGCIMRSLFGAGKPRHVQVLAERLSFLYFAIVVRLCRLRSTLAPSKTISAADRDQQLGLAA